MSHDRGARWRDTKYVLVDGKLRQKVTRNIERKKTIVTTYKVKARFSQPTRKLPVAGCMAHVQTPYSQSRPISYNLLGLRFRGEAFDSALMSTGRGAAAVLNYCVRVRVARVC